MRRRNWWHLPVLLTLAIVLGLVLLVVEVVDRGEKRDRELLLSQTSALERERDELIARRDALDRKYYEEIRCQATEQLVFLRPEETVYRDIYPLLRQRGLIGVLALSPEAMPGDKGMMTAGEFTVLQKEGWGLCLRCSDSGDFTQWDRDMTAKLRQAGIDKPETLYLDENQYSAALEEEIVRCGYRTVVHHGEAGLPRIAGDVEEPLWRVGTQPWNFHGVQDQIGELVRQGGSECFFVRIDSGLGEYVEHSFLNMLDFVEPRLENGSLAVTDFEQARALHDPAQNGKPEREAAWREESEAMTARIRELEEQIMAVYAQWNGD